MRAIGRMVRPFAMILVGLGLEASAATPKGDEPVLDEAARDIREAWAPAAGREGLAIGVFDSGTGGLAVLNAILGIDVFDNQRRVALPAGDGRRDFESEQFVFLADQANMPYGNYPAVGKTRYLRELVLKDAEFLMGRSYWPTADAEAPGMDKRPVKAIVIACNTATAYGKCDIEEMLQRAGVDVPVVGVIDAGAQAALEALKADATIGVMATAGTVASGAYPRAVRAVAVQRGCEDRIHVVQQGSLGLAGAIDGAREFVVAGEGKPRADYRGPGFENPKAPIDRRHLRRYGFDFSRGRMRYEGTADEPTVLQLNSVENYVAYEMVSLLETVRASENARPLRAIILGCTHFPYVAEAIRAQLRRLYDYQEEGRYRYRPIMDKTVQLVDPATATPVELYRRLARQAALASSRRSERGQAEFFMTVPNPRWPGAGITPEGWFTYEYKYGRESGLRQPEVRTVRLRPELLDRETRERLAKQVPEAWKRLEEEGKQ